MQQEFTVKGKSLGGSSDLTLLAPIKAGFIESLESVTYKTRIKKVLEALHLSRQSSHEYAMARLLSDSIERVAVIQSVRVAVLEPENKVLLVVTFDGSWESYIRVLWDKVGTLLDLIFCSTEGYVTASNHTYGEWVAWAKKVQVASHFFYGPPDFTARDALYQRRLEHMREQRGHSALDELRASLPTAQESNRRLVGLKVSRQADEPSLDWGGDVIAARQRMLRERMSSGLQSLSGLYRLADLFGPPAQTAANDINDGEVLRRAALDLLSEFTPLRHRVKTEWEEQKNGRFARQIAWLNPDQPMDRAPRPGPINNAIAQLSEADQADIQGGILRGYDNVTHGVAVMLAFDSTQAFRQFIANQLPLVTKFSSDHTAQGNTVLRNVALTHTGLGLVGLHESELDLFAQAFRHGMAARAGHLGDVRANHPRRWRLPTQYTAQDTSAPAPTVALEAVHAVLFLRSNNPDSEVVDWSEHHPLHAQVQALGALSGTKVLAVQALRRYTLQSAQNQAGAAPSERVVEHFGYTDGNGEPDLEGKTDSGNQIHLGEVLQGHANAADFGVQSAMLRNGSYLVLRKYKQYVHRLESAVAQSAQQLVDAQLQTPKLLGDVPKPEAVQELVYAKMMGRWRDGTALIDGGAGGVNNFDYSQDEQGKQCPMRAHIRLSNPRDQGADAAVRAPRLMRRSMSYGPRHTPGTNDDQSADRGLLFMAYVADLSEQYETIQRWLTGANGTAISSAKSCPFTGVAQSGVAGTFAFEHKFNDRELDSDARHIGHVQLQTHSPVFDEPEGFTRLEWGMYLFTPSLSALKTLSEMGHSTKPVWAAQAQADNDLGAQLIAQLQKDDAILSARPDLKTERINAWKAALEDPVELDTWRSAAIWASIRAHHGGLLQTPYGTLVADKGLIGQVLADKTPVTATSQTIYSSQERQHERMRHSFGEIYLGEDEGVAYHAQADAINDAIHALSDTPKKQQAVYDLAYRATNKKLGDLLSAACEKTDDGKPYAARFHVLELAEEVVADLIEAWFGIQDDGIHFKRSGSDIQWTAGPALYPGMFTAPSRYMFQPHPNATVDALGRSYGAALRARTAAFVADSVRHGTFLSHAGAPAPLSQAILTHPMATDSSQALDARIDFVAKNMVGVIMGFAPTLLGVLYNVVREWQNADRFELLRARMAGNGAYDHAYAQLYNAMITACQVRPVPPNVWRTSASDHTLCPHVAQAAKCPHSIDVKKGDKVVLGLASGMQQDIEEGKSPDAMLMFGGVRTWPASTNTGPTHACPGYEAALMAMLGCLAALLARSETLRTLPGSAQFSLEAIRPVAATPPATPSLTPKPSDAAPAAPSVVAQSPKGLYDGALNGVKNFAVKALKLFGKVTSTATVTIENPISGAHNALVRRVQKAKLTMSQNATTEGSTSGLAGGKKLLLCWGDSWLDYRLSLQSREEGGLGIPMGTDVRDQLEKLGYETPADFCDWSNWGYASQLASDSDPFTKELRRRIERGGRKAVHGIVLSGGGNDSVEKPLEDLFERRGSANPYKANQPLTHVSRVAADLDTAAQSCSAAISLAMSHKPEHLRYKIPVVLHGYAIPFPDHDAPLKRWLHDPFVNKGYDLSNTTDIEAARAVMHTFGEALNAQIQALATALNTQPNASPYVTFMYVDMRAEIAALSKQGQSIKQAWNDPMHLSDEGFALVAKKMAASIEAFQKQNA